MIGPIPLSTSREAKNKTVKAVDILYLLRQDGERVSSYGTIDDELKALLVNRSMTWTVAEWNDAKKYYNASTQSKILTFPTKSAFNMEPHLGSAVAMFASAAVIVTDRLHASILSLLMTKPHVYLDQSYGKVSSTRSVALSSSASCLNLEGTLFTSASSLRDATEKTISFASR